MKRIVYILTFVLCPLLAFSQNVQQAEYFIDTDPGAGLATPMLAYDGNFNDALETVIKSNVGGWTIGQHLIGVRVLDNTGHWGVTFRTVIDVQSPYVLPVVNVAAAEMFWDTDPGQGNGTAMLAFDGNFNDALEKVVIAAPAPALGMHVLNIRVRDAQNHWGPVFRTIADVQSPYVMPVINVAAAECFWDTDPGQGNGTAMLAFDGNFNSAMEVVMASALGTPGLGMHILHVRVRDAQNHWGPVFRTIVDVQNPFIPVIIKVTTGELFWDTDPGQGNATPMLAFDGNFDDAYEVTVKTEQAFYLAQGLHVLNVRARGANGGWSPLFRTVVYLDSCITNPTVTATAGGPTTFCSGDSVQLTANGAFSNYYWRRNGSPIGGNTSSVWVTQSGNYVVTALDTNGCPATSQIVSVTVQNPVAGILPSGTVNICSGDSVQLDAGAGFTTYNWSTGAASQTIWVTTAGNYTVEVTSSAGCSDTSAVTNVNVWSLPALPVISQNADTLFSTTGTSYQWYLNGNPIPGANGSYYVASQSGNYTVIITDTNGCTVVSAAYAYIHMDFGQAAGGNPVAVVYPNPVTSQSTLYVHGEGLAGNVTIEIRDVTGRVVGVQIVKGDDNGIAVELGTFNFAQGLYVYTITPDNSDQLTGRFIVQ